MLKALSKLLGFFSIYSHPVEKKFDRLLGSLAKNASKKRVRRKVLSLMQKNMVAVQLWSERRYKGYKETTKKERRTMIERAKRLSKKIDHLIRQKKAGTTRLAYLHFLNQFFHREGRFTYREHARFSELLKDPLLEKFTGDCNQMVTMYVFLYSRKFNISDLSIKIYPGHVCLHFKGEDLEVTNGTFTKYKEKGQQILPIEELVAINILDIDDEHGEKHQVLSKTRLEADLLHFLLGTHSEAAEHNLKVSQQNEWFRLYKTLGEIKTIDHIRQKKETLRKMLKLAKEVENKEWKEWCEGLLKYTK